MKGRVCVLLALLAGTFLVSPSQADKEQWKYTHYTDPEHGWEFGPNGDEWDFFEAKRFHDAMNMPGARAAVNMFGGLAGLERTPEGKLYQQILDERGQYLTCCLNPNGTTLVLSRGMETEFVIGDSVVASKACFVFDSIKYQCWLWDSRTGNALTLSPKTIEKVEHSPLGWIMVVVLLDERIEDVAKINEVRVSGVRVGEFSP